MLLPRPYQIFSAAIPSPITLFRLRHQNKIKRGAYCPSFGVMLRHQSLEPLYVDQDVDVRRALPVTCRRRGLQPVASVLPGNNRSSMGVIVGSGGTCVPELDACVGNRGAIGRGADRTGQHVPLAYGVSNRCAGTVEGADLVPRGRGAAAGISDTLPRQQQHQCEQATTREAVLPHLTPFGYPALQLYDETQMSAGYTVRI